MELEYVVNQINAKWGCNVLFMHNEEVNIAPILWNFIHPTLQGPMSLKMLLDHNFDMKVDYKHICGVEQCIYLSIGYLDHCRTFLINF